MKWTPPPREPWAERLIQIGKNLGDDGRSFIQLDAASLLAAAEAATGLSDWGDDAFLAPLGILCRAFDEEAELHLLGRMFARSDLQRTLQSRLRVNAWLGDHPEIADERIERPVFVTGLGRTGTTLLHELLAQDPTNRVPRLWELYFPVPPPQAASAANDPRIAAADAEIGLMDAAIPAMTSMHENAGDLPNECIFLFVHDLVTDMFTGQYRIPSYSNWVAQCDMAPLYATHRRLLQLLQSSHRLDRWVLKAPSHLAELPALFGEYPDARVAWVHRDPLQAIGSLCSLMGTLQWMRSDHIDYDAGVAAISFGFPYLCERVMKQRDEGTIPGDRIDDVLYADLVRNPLDCVRKLYIGWGDTLSAEAENNMRSWLDRRGRTRSASHEYSFDTTGLDRVSERARVSAYQERYGVVSEV